MDFVLMLLIINIGDFFIVLSFLLIWLWLMVCFIFIVNVGKWIIVVVNLCFVKVLVIVFNKKDFFILKGFCK